MNHTLNSEQRRAVFLASLGGALEFYDFIIYVVFAKGLQENFFPSQDKYAGLLGVFAVFAIGYLVRPFGGIFFSHFGDSKGRKAVFSYTVFLMALPTFLIGLLPTWHQLGLVATILLVLLRLLQGLALGGEIPGSITFVSEYVDVKKRAMVCALVYCGINLGLVLGSAVADSLHFVLSENDFFNWGWRIAFLFGGILGVISFQLRQKLNETPVFINYLAQQKTHKLPLLKAFKKNHMVALLQGFGLTSLGATIVALLYLFTPIYATTFLNYPTTYVTQWNTLNTLLFALMNAIIGFLSLRMNKQLLLVISTVGLLIVAIPIYMLMSHHYLALAMVLVSLFAGSYVGLYPSRLVSLFETGFRYTGYAISYNIGFAIFGGLAPLIATMLIHFTHDLLAPAYYLMAIAVVGLVSVVLSHRLEQHNTSF